LNGGQLGCAWLLAKRRKSRVIKMAAASTAVVVMAATDEYCW
jgi:hypothetical protein